MNCNNLKYLKAAFVCAAFLFATAESSADYHFDSIKAKATELLLQKKKSQAIQVLTEYIKTKQGVSPDDESVGFVTQIAKKFISREAQEAYENSINLTLENIKQSIKSNEQCLLLEPQQLECLVQKVRLLIRNKNSRNATEIISQIKEIVPGSKYDSWLNLLTLKNDPEFKNRQIIKNLPEKNSEENMGLILLELDRSFIAKNYSRAKDILFYFERNYPDWPDLVFYKYKINLESSEEKQKAGSDTVGSQPLILYANKCKGLSKTISRKFRYDFDLCTRNI